VDCTQALPLISARLDGELPPGDAADLDAHVAACPACAAAADAFRLQDADLRRAFAPRRAAAARVAERVIGRLPAAPAPHRRTRWWPLLLSAAAGFLLAVVIFRPWQRPTPPPPIVPPEPAPALQLALTTGAVEAQPPGKNYWCPLETGSKVAVGTRVRTPPKVSCEFCCPDDGTEVRLNGGTELAVETARRLALDRGQILAKVLQDAVPLEVRLTDVTVLALGTQFDLLAQPQDTRLAVLQGQTKVRGSGGDTVVDSGQMATIINGKVTDLREGGRRLLQATAWTQELLLLKRRDNAELDKRVNDILAQIGGTKEAAFTDDEIRSLGSHCVLPLTRFIESDRSRGAGQQDRRQRAARLIADLAQPWHVAELIDLLADDDGAVRYYAATGLARLVPDEEPLTPQTWRDAPPEKRQHALQEWRDWWAGNKDRFPSVR
jgi:ferric-dicitrate binding protein FerR (iron transport regulator)